MRAFRNKQIDNQEKLLLKLVILTYQLLWEGILILKALITFSELASSVRSDKKGII